MKRNILCLLLMVAMVCVSCNKEVKKASGDYSFKMSGKVDFTDAEGNTAFIFYSERGQMNILADKKGNKGDIIVTFNTMNGSNYSCTGKIKGDSIFFDTHEYFTRFSTADTALNSLQIGKLYRITASGKGIINDNMIIAEESWTGVREDGEGTFMKAKKISVLAEKN